MRSYHPMPDMVSLLRECCCMFRRLRFLVFSIGFLILRSVSYRLLLWANFMKDFLVLTHFQSGHFGGQLLFGSLSETLTVCRFLSGLDAR